MKRLCIVSLVLGGLVACSYINGKGDSEKFAREWAAQNIVGAEHTAVSCMGRDTDNNGYVSCTVTASWPGDPRAEVIPLECSVNKPGSGCGNEGCRSVVPYGRRR